MSRRIPPLSTPDSRPKLWTNGTLVYTIGGLATLFFWLLGGDFAWQMKERSVPYVVPLLLRNLGASDALTGGLIGSLPQFLGMILGPIVAVKSDRHRGRWGRRIPFMLAPTPVAVLAMVALAYCGQIGAFFHHALGARSPGLDHVTLIVMICLWTIFEFAAIIANSVFSALINDVVPHSVIGRFFGYFRAFSLMAGMVFNFWLMGMAETHYPAIFLGIGALYAMGFTLMCLMVREGEYPPPPPAPEREGLGMIAPVVEYLRESFGRIYYVWVFLAVSLPMVAFIVINIYSAFYAKSVGMSLDTYGKYLALTYLFSLGLAYPLGSLADRYHPLRVGIAVLVLYVIVALGGGLFASTPAAFAVALVAHGVLSGAWMTGAGAILQMLLPREKFAQYASAQSIIAALAVMMASPLMGTVLDWTRHTYRYTFYGAFFIAMLALVSCIILHGQFMKLGGPRHYTAP